MSQPLQLPPGIPNGVAQSVFTISFPRLIFSRINLSSAVSSFKFWGEENEHVIDWASSPCFQYSVITNYQSFISYLKDMKILVVQFKDKRTKSLLATGICNFIILSNSFQQINGQWTIDILQRKNKIGQFIVKFQFKEESKRMSLTNSNQNYKSNINPKSTNTANINTIFPSNQIQNQIFQKDASHKYLTNLEINLQKRQNQQENYMYQNKPATKLKPKKDVLLEFKQLGLFDNQTTLTHSTINYQLQASKLKLDEMELLNFFSFSSNQLNLMFSHITNSKQNFSSSSQYQLQIDFPIVGNKSSKSNTFTIWSLKSEPHTIYFSQKISVIIEDQKLTDNQLREYLNGKILVQLIQITKGQKKLKSHCQIRLSDLLGTLRKNKHIKLQMVRKVKQKEEVDCQLYVKQYYQKSQLPSKEPKPSSQLSTENLICQKTSQKHMNFQLTIYISELRLLKIFSSNNYYIRVIIGENVFKSEPQWKILQPNFDMLIHVPVPPNHNLKFVIVQLWNKKQQEFLCGTAEIMLDVLDNFASLPQKCKVGSSLLPYIYLNQSKQVRTLKNALFGYLNMKFAVGTPSQIFNLNRQINQYRKKQPANLDIQAKPNKETNNQKKPVPIKIDLKEEIDVNVNPNDNGINIKNNNLELKSEVEQFYNPPHLSSISDDSKTHIIDQLSAPSSLYTILVYILHEFSLSQNYYKFLDQLLNKTSYFSITQFSSLMQNKISNLLTYDVSRISFFFVRDLKIKVSSFTKSIESYRQYEEILNQQYCPMIRRLKQEMDYQMMSVSMLEIHMKKYSINGVLTKLQFKDSLLSIFKLTLSEIQKLFLFSSNDKYEVILFQFCDSLRKFDVYDSIKSHKYSFSTYSSFVFEQLQSILQQMPQSIQILISSINIPKQQAINCHELIQMFQIIEVQLSLWEAFIIIQKIKSKKYLQGLDQGLISKQIIVMWLQKLVPNKIFRSPTFGLLQNGVQNKPSNFQIEQIKVKPQHKHFINSNPSKFKTLTLQFSFPAKPQTIKVFGQVVKIIHYSVSDVQIQIDKQMQDLVIEIVTKDQILKCQGRIGEWVVVYEDQNYVGDLLIL